MNLLPSSFFSFFLITVTLHFDKNELKRHGNINPSYDWVTRDGGVRSERPRTVRVFLEYVLIRANKQNSTYHTLNFDNHGSGCVVRTQR